MECIEDLVHILEKAKSGPPPEELSSHFHRHSDLLFAWRAVAPFEDIAGEFRISHIGEVMIRGSRVEPVDPADSPTDRLVKQLKVFETHPVGGTGTYTALRLSPDQRSSEVWYFDLRQGPTRLHLTYGEYLDTMLRTKGLYDWQYLFADPDPDNYGMCVSLPYVRKGFGLLAREFPEVDLSDLVARLEERAQVVEGTA
jgi:hypothetical protein